MTKAPVTIISNGKTYAIDLADAEAIRQIPAAEREQLIAALKEIELQHKLAEHAVNAAANRAKAVVKAAPGQPAQAPAVNRLASADADQLMAKLIMEERKGKKPPLTAQTLYKWMAAILAVIAILVMYF